MKKIMEALSKVVTAEGAKPYNCRAVKAAKNDLLVVVREFGDAFEGEAIVNGEKTGCNTAVGLTNWLVRRARHFTELEIMFADKMAESYAEKRAKMTETEKLQADVEWAHRVERATARNCYDEF